MGLRGGGQFLLNPVDTVDAVDEKDEDKNKCDLQPVLEFGNNGVLRNKAEIALQLVQNT